MFRNLKIKIIKSTILFLFVAISSSLVTGVYVLNFFKDTASTYYKINLAKGIDEIISVEIGGLKQTLQIRGHNKDAPILLYLHGGPGSNQINLSHKIQTPLEEYFVNVQWDQRGAGKSYYPIEEIQETMTISQMLSDTEEVVSYLRDRFKRDKIFIIGHSWGSILGATLAQKRPDWFHAYIGMGQVVNMMENEKIGYERSLKLAQENNNQEAIKELELIAPYPNPENPTESLKLYSGVTRKWLQYYGKGTFHQMSGDANFFKVLISWMLLSRDFSYSEMYNLLTLSAEDNPSTNLLNELMAVNLPKDIGYKFEVPVFMFIGAHDWITIESLADAYFEKIEAPYKEKIIFENSGHMYSMEEPGKFFNTLVNHVLPIAN